MNITERDRPIQLEMDEDASDVLAFMVRNVPASKLVSVADAVGKLAPVLWGHHPQDEVRALSLREPPITACEPHTQPSATTLHPVQ